MAVPDDTKTRIIFATMKVARQVKDLKVTRIENARAFYRLNTDLDATVTTFSGLGAGEKPCKLLNISVGGACIGSSYRYHKGDKFLLKIKLFEDRPESAMLCQVLRIVEKEEAEHLLTIFGKLLKRYLYG